MADKNVNGHAYFYNSKSDRYYNADGISDFLSPFFKQGVFNGTCKITANDNMSVSMAVGYSWVGLDGSTVKRLKHFTEIQTFDIETASGTLDRIDTIVVRRNDTDRDITAAYVKGSLSSEPVPTAPTRSGAVYEIVLAQIKVPAGTVKVTQDMITDTRMNSDLCGWVVSNVEEVDFSQITAQFEAFFTAYEGKAATRYSTFNDYMALLQQQGDTKYAELVAAFNTYTAQQQSDFSTWFTSMKGQLSTDAAGNLQSEIDAAAEKEFNRYYGLMNGSSVITKDSSGKTSKIVVTDDDAVATTTFSSDAAAGIKTITTAVVPVSGQYQYTKTTVITKKTGSTVISTSYTKSAKA